ncbi:hypothetical protein C0585_03605 [Candidatus Woesearchaeota archaeon]|nr:MAG: hypothetical protein C0585_03605 [Candidatus Woesearchaeota archaeon]
MDVTSLAKKLIDISSVTGKEKEILLFIEKYLEDNKIDFERIYVSEDRWNIFAFKGNSDILLSGHCDTVNSEKHYKSYDKEGKLYGIGSSDMKGGLAGIINTFISLDDCNLLVTVGEESGFDGIKAFIDSEFCKKIRYSIIAEPTDLTAIGKQFGLFGFDISSEGTQRHTSQFKKGNHCGHDLIIALNKAMKDFNEKFPKSIFSINVLEYGEKRNIIPDIATCKIDIRISPFDKILEIREFVLEEFKEFNTKFRYVLEPVSADEEFESHLFEKNIKLDMKIGFTEMYFFNRVNIKTLIFGPGLVEQAHKKNEYLPLENLISYEKKLKELIENVK